MVYDFPFAIPSGSGVFFSFLFFLLLLHKVCSILVASDKLLFLIHSIG
jgi:hypothetical protein